MPLRNLSSKAMCRAWMQFADLTYETFNDKKIQASSQSQGYVGVVYHVDMLICFFQL